MRIRRALAHEVGGCNFCDHDRRIVFECRGDFDSHATLLARICVNCALDLKQMIAPSDKRAG